jgi:hypothetical protein
MELQSDNSLTCPGYPYFKLYLTDTNDEINKGQDYGRLAFSCATEDIYTLSKASETVLTAPVTLKTKGKADVIVTILASPDGHELCFVNDDAFRELSKETDFKIDWTKYDQNKDKTLEFKTEL